MRIYNTNTDKIIHATYKVRDGKVLSDGTYAIPGVPSTGDRIKLEFFSPAGSITGKLLPTGHVKDTIDFFWGGGEQGVYTVSIVDAGNPVVYLIPEESGLKGTELPVEAEGLPEVLKRIEAIRSAAGHAHLRADLDNSVQGMSAGNAVDADTLGFVENIYADAFGVAVAEIDEIGMGDASAVFRAQADRAQRG